MLNVLSAVQGEMTPAHELFENTSEGMLNKVEECTTRHRLQHKRSLISHQTSDVTLNKILSLKIECH